MFIEEQLELNKRELLAAGKELNEFYKNERVSNIESSVDVAISHAKVAGDNKDFVSLQKQKDEIDQKINELKILKDVPQQVYLQYLNLKKTLLTQVYSLLTQQYEMAKIQESKEDLSFQLIDPPQVPDKRSKPKRKLIVMVAFISSVFIAVFVSFLLEYIQKFRSELRSRSV